MTTFTVAPSSGVSYADALLWRLSRFAPLRLCPTRTLQQIGDS